MNRKQKVAIVVGALAIAGLALFPPWVEYEVFAQGTIPMERHLRPDWAFSSVEPSSEVAFTNIDWTWCNNIQLAALALTVAAVVVMKDRKPAS